MRKASKIGTIANNPDRSGRYSREVLVEQILWLIRLRWFAGVGLVVAALIGTYIFPVLVSAVPVYICAGTLLLCNIFYLRVATKQTPKAGRKNLVLAMVQAGVDLLILTVALHFSGGISNPFFLFYIFHVIIATMILPRNLAFTIGLTAILLFGLLAVNELNGGTWLGHHPLQLSVVNGLWRNPVYVLGAFVAFVCTIVLTQHLTRIIIMRMTAKHRSLEKDLRDRAEQITAINEMLRMSRVEMAQREKMVAVGQMAAGIAHEIGNPLASLSSVAQYLGRKLSTPEGKEHLLVIEQQVNRISSILKRMLSLSRPATTEYKWTDINELIDSTLSLVKFDKRMQSVTIKNTAGTDLPMVWLNPQNFEQVLLNIFINALDAINAKQTEQEHFLEITTGLEGGMVEIRVSDTGIGMSPEVCKRAFESFFTTKEIGKGTGLGLFISYNLVAEIDGTIELQSELGRGTTVIIRIPVRSKKDLISDGDSREDLDSVKAEVNYKTINKLQERYTER